MNSLKQVGVGLASYTGDYSEYFPSWVGWSGKDDTWCNSASACTVDHSVTSSVSYYLPVNWTVEFKGRSTDTPVKVTHSAGGYRDWRIGYYRVIGHSVKHRDELMVAGKLNMAPHGIGMLLSSGYLADAAVYYCPSSAGMPSDWAQTPAAGGGMLGASGLRDWARAGGRDSTTMLYGNWTGISAEIMATDWRVRSIVSHYAYRNVPLSVREAWHSYEQVPGTLAVPGTRPAIVPRIGQPLFRTNKELGGRALVSDTFSKGSRYVDGAGRNTDSWLSAGANTTLTSRIAGMGISAHRNAYQVLYGDGRVATFGDPNETIIWHTQGWDSAAVADRDILGANSFWGNGSGGKLGPFLNGCNTVDHKWTKHTSLAVWNEFDVAGGIDAP